MFLLFADQEGGGKTIVLPSPRYRGRLSQPHIIAVAAAVIFPERGQPKELLEVIPGGNYYPLAALPPVIFDRFQSFKIFLKGMDIGVIKIPVDLMPLVQEGFKGIGSAGRAADM